ncbi:hypothetical protein [Natrinema hispanicum]|uniref:hypothetical protein n=1 Tax=Natrinema hispanicum TaxID=392421 RepID=UPI0013EE4F5C|nr:hypothetical protein [Natrinema hispanicum]
MRPAKPPRVDPEGVPRTGNETSGEDETGKARACNNDSETERPDGNLWAGCAGTEGLA